MSNFLDQAAIQAMKRHCVWLTVMVVDPRFRRCRPSLGWSIEVSRFPYD